MENKSSKVLFLLALLMFGLMGAAFNGLGHLLANAQGISDTNSTGSFSSNKDLFVTSEPTGFGIYEEKNSTTFAPGESIILYIEPVGFEYKNITDKNGNPLFSIDFGASFLLTSANGTILGGQENVPIGNIVSHNQNKEVFIPFTVTQSIPLPTGDYGIIYKITDENSGKTFEINKNITIK